MFLKLSMKMLDSSEEEPCRERDLRQAQRARYNFNNKAKLGVPNGGDIPCTWQAKAENLPTDFRFLYETFYLFCFNYTL